MKRQMIDGRDVVEEFIVLHHEWECDGYGTRFFSCGLSISPADGTVCSGWP